ncbi:TM2 domain-containing protein [Flavobacterium salilacus subsp. salilacus]|uniref:TM2 domain-containing protein n=1 Tax=Flavobacterium TaxID=237 RepID=UPI00107540FA|nr:MULTISPECIES: TM2 domain-containing protein [Flavobacterium]KAF2518648.1 TM2 domain-containing protein [Flavobacterium salilacus subsp. salilacus]MBE1613609.1 TM2 domain-containing protein [Flavobacterium sp. SaA2.13]
MNEQKVDLFITTNARYFESHQVNNIRERLMKVDESKWASIQAIDFKDPKTTILVSIFAGGLGIDRFMIGDTGLGVAKLLTCGGAGIWTIIDWFGIQKITRQKNLEKINLYI